MTAAAADGGDMVTGVVVSAGGSLAGSVLLTAGSLALAASLAGGVAAAGALLVAFKPPPARSIGLVSSNPAFRPLACSPAFAAGRIDVVDAICLMSAPDVATEMRRHADLAGALTGALAGTPAGTMPGTRADRIADTPARMLPIPAAAPATEVVAQQDEEPRAIPEPGTLLILATGALAALGLRHARNRMRG